jgi:hypothetical protein
MKRRHLMSSVGALLAGGCTGAPSNRGSDNERTGEATGTTSASDETSASATTVSAEKYTVTGPTRPTNSIRRVERTANAVTVYLDGYETMEYAEIDVLPVASPSDEPLTLTGEQVRNNPPLRNGLGFYRSELDEVEVNAEYEAGQRVKRRLDSYWEADGRDTDRPHRERVYEFGEARFAVGFKFYG